jgi:hypothetical protein
VWSTSRSVLALVLTLVSCRHPDATPTPVRPTPARPTALAGWISITPDEDRLRCASQSLREWRVAYEQNALSVVEATGREPDTGPQLPFALPKSMQVLARAWVTRHVLAAGDEFLVGFDAGEWGGSLHVFSVDGKRHREVAKGNVRGLVAFGDDVVSIEGFTFMSLSEGNLRWLHRDGGAWKQVALVPLDTGPETFAIANDALYVVTLKSLVRAGRDRKATVVQPVPSGGLYRNSMVVDETGTLWLGMRDFVVRLAPQGGGYEQTWFVRERCDPKS